MKSLNSLQPLGLLLLRVVVGGIFVYHGYPKLLHRGTGMAEFFVQHGLPAYFVYVSGIVEVFGGGLLVLGLFARAAGVLLAIEMGVAIWKVHSGGGITAVHNYEFPLALGVAAFAIATVGAGTISLDWPLSESGGSRPSRPSKTK